MIERPIKVRRIINEIGDRNKRKDEKVSVIKEPKIRMAEREAINGNSNYRLWHGQFVVCAEGI